MKLSYEQPSFKKYGTMKEFTQSTIGSGADGMGGNDKGGGNTTDPTVNNGNIDIGQNNNIYNGNNTNQGRTGTFDPIQNDK